MRQADIERRLSNLAKARRCGARTRAGHPCRQAAVTGRALPNARRGKRLGRTSGQAQRQFQAWGLDSRERELARGHASQGSGDQGPPAGDRSRPKVGQVDREFEPGAKIPPGSWKNAKGRMPGSHARCADEQELRALLMTEKEPPAGEKDAEMVGADDPYDLKGLLKRLGGSQSDHWNKVLIDQTVHTLGLNRCDGEARERRHRAALAGLIGIGPQDEVEGMMAAQLLATHNAAMECYRRAMIAEQTLEGRRENLNQANKLARTYATLIEALNRHRGKGQQKVTVEHVHVHAGGQAVVGMVETPGGGDRAKSEEQPHAKQIAHAPQPAVWSADKEREPVPVASDAERPLPDARRALPRRPEG